MNSPPTTLEADETRKSICIGGVPIAAVTRKEFVTQVMRKIHSRQGGWVCTVNADILRQLHLSGEVRELLADATDYVADGRPLLWAARLAGTPLPERVCGSDLIYDFSAQAALEGRRIFLIGGNPGTAERAGVTLAQLYPGLQVAGFEYPEFGFEKNERRLEEIVSKVARSQPDIVFVALGFPKQERLIKVLRQRLPGAWYLGVGISFSFVCGDVKRAPRWMQAVGLEWLHRLFQEPGRLWRRYLVHDVPFVGRLLWSSKFRPSRLLIHNESVDS